MKEYKYKINGNDYTVAVGDIENNIAQVEVNGTPYKVELEEKAAAKAPVKTVKAAPAPRTATGAPVVSKPATSGGADALKSPLPGTILDIKVKEGDAVKRGQLVVILEAMKMENNINAQKDGVVKAIKVSKGDSVLEGTELIVIE